MTPDQRLADFLRNIIDAIDRINRYVAHMDAKQFFDDELTQDAVIRNIEIIGEASHRIESQFPHFAEKHPELPVRSAYQMRNAVAHGYFSVDLVIVWNTVTRDPAKVARTATRLLDTLDSQ